MGFFLQASDGSLYKTEEEEDVAKRALTIVVLGASGDLAKKKTFPALFQLHRRKLLPPHALIVGYARSNLSNDEYQNLIKSGCKGAKEDELQTFLDKTFYFRGNYDSSESFIQLDKFLASEEPKRGGENGSNRIFYFAIPPTVFVSAAKAIQPNALSKTGWNRIVVEKPFGRDTESSVVLAKELGSLFSEDQLYRIDHYLGKEMVQNLMVLRFANEVFEPIWNRNHIKNVQITFKEDFGTQGRGGYFDESGIIRDVMQNHLIQILALIGMEPPVSLNAEDVRDEKAKLLRAIPPLTLPDIIIGQYVSDSSSPEPSYLSDPTVPPTSITPTFACAVLQVNNSRWQGVPFILRCGKALNERKAEIRIQFRKPANNLFESLQPNELVVRVQPGEAVYLKMTTKKPGLTLENVYTELDLSYANRFTADPLPDAYERLILDVIRGDHNLFVRNDELTAAWKIFTPVLHKLEEEKIKPISYKFGTRGPPEADELAQRYGYIRPQNYSWAPSTTTRK